MIKTCVICKVQFEASTRRRMTCGKKQCMIQHKLKSNWKQAVCYLQI